MSDDLEHLGRLDDPDPPAATASHRTEVARRAHRRRAQRATLSGGAGLVAVLLAVGLSVALVGSGSSRPERSAGGPDVTVPGSAHASTSAGPGHAGPLAGSANGTEFAPSQSNAAPTPAPCPADATIPSEQAGRYCGPTPTAGNGLGPNGECTGHETDPPCGPGVVAGTYYAYTLPVRCDGVVLVDGRRWYSELTPPATEQDIDVWMLLSAAGQLRWIGPEGSGGLVPDTGQAAPTCSDDADTSPSSGTSG
ncbi:MAG: hypothetical protein ACLQOZ_00355 [Acidimicrobiales bacterium]|jgi:hypothetical protein